MNSLERAKRFLASKTAKLALIAVPLAIAVPAAFGSGIIQSNTQGTTGSENVFSFSSNAGCSVFSGSGTCGLEQLSSVGGNPLGNWVDDYTTSNFISPTANGDIYFITSGSASGIVSGGAAIPVSWNFNLIQQSQPATATVAIEWILLDSDGEELSLTENQGSLSAGNYANSATFQLPSSFSGGTTVGLTGYEILMSVTGDSSLNLSVPEGTSIDFNPGSAAPEPSTFVLGGAGLLGLLRLRRRKRVKV